MDARKAFLHAHNVKAKQNSDSLEALKSTIKKIEDAIQKQIEQGKFTATCPCKQPTDKEERRVWRNTIFDYFNARGFGMGVNNDAVLISWHICPFDRETTFNKRNESSCKLEAAIEQNSEELATEPQTTEQQESQNTTEQNVTPNNDILNWIAQSHIHTITEKLLKANIDSESGRLEFPYTGIKDKLIDNIIKRYFQKCGYMVTIFSDSISLNWWQSAFQPKKEATEQKETARQRLLYKWIKKNLGYDLNNSNKSADENIINQWLVENFTSQEICQANKKSLIPNNLTPDEQWCLQKVSAVEQKVVNWLHTNLTREEKMILAFANRIVKLNPNLASSYSLGDLIRIVFDEYLYESLNDIDFHYVQQVKSRNSHHV
jgi:hypothetical protein